MQAYCVLQAVCLGTLLLSCCAERTERQSRGLPLVRLGKRGMGLIRLGRRMQPDGAWDGLEEAGARGWLEEELGGPLDVGERQVIRLPRIGRDTKEAEVSSVRRRRSIENTGTTLDDNALDALSELAGYMDLDDLSERALTMPRFGRGQSGEDLTRSITLPRFGKRRGMSLVRLGKRGIPLVRLGKRNFPLVRLGKKSADPQSPLGVLEYVSDRSPDMVAPQKKGMSLVRLGRSTDNKEAADEEMTH